MSFSGSLFMHDADFSNSRFDGPVQLRSHFDGNLELRNASGRQLDLLPPSPDESVVRRPNLFAPDSQVMLQNAVFDKMVVHWPQLAGHLGSAAENPVADLQPVYDHLHRLFASQGLRDDAAACRVEWQELRLDSSGWTEGEWYWLQLLRLTTYYGTDRTDRASIAGCLYTSMLTFVRLMPGEGKSRSQQLVLFVEAVVSWVCWGIFVATVVARFL